MSLPAAESLPAGWTIAPLGDLVDVLDSQRVPLNAEERSKRPGVVPYYGATGPVGTVDSALFDEDLLLLGEDGVPFFDPDKPKSYLISGPSWVNNHAHVLRCHVERSYLKYYLDSFDYTGFANGTTRLKLTQAAMLRIPVLLPPLGEQQRIVSRLAGAFEGLELIRDDIGKLRKRLSGWSEQSIRLGLTGRLTRFQGAAGEAEGELEAVLGHPVPKPADEVPELPADWCWTTLGALCEVSGGVTKDSKKQSGPGMVEVPYLRVANVQQGFLDLRDVSKIRVPLAKAEALRLRPGDVLFNEGGDRDKLGRGWVWNGEIDDCVHQNHVFRARVREQALAPRLLSWHGNTFGRAWFEGVGKQSTNLASLSMTNLKKLPVPVPPRAQQEGVLQAIALRLDGIKEIQGRLDDLERMTRALQTALLKSASAGRLVPQDEADVPAQVLLQDLIDARSSARTEDKGKRPSTVAKRRRQNKESA